MAKPNILFIMCDQLRADSVAALGNPIVKTPNIDRLVRRGTSFTHAYSTCPVCVPARYTIRTGREPYNTGYYSNEPAVSVSLYPSQPSDFKQQCGEYLPAYLRTQGYFTFGVGKFHTNPWNEDLGYDVQMYCEEFYDTPEQRKKDHYHAFIEKEHPEFAYIEQLQGERTDMYYMPQMSPFPAHLTSEAWVVDQCIELLGHSNGEPYFGFASFVGPHPPFAPPIPYNRMYNPDRMPEPVCGDINEDLRDEHLSWMNYLIWAEDVSKPLAQSLKARYYGEITYIDHCIGRLLDAVETRADASNTLICFFSDHGDHLGDHHAWQKESFFDASARVPFLVSWPSHISQESESDALVCLTDLFGIATGAAGAKELRDGIDILSLLNGNDSSKREILFGYYGPPGDALFKIMTRSDRWKYIYMANGGGEQLFDMENDPCELHNQSIDNPSVADYLRDKALEKCLSQPNLTPAVKDGKLLTLPFRRRELTRIHQFDVSRNIFDYIYP